MQISFDEKDLAVLLNRAMAGKAEMTLEALGEDVVELRVAQRPPVILRLSDFRLSGSTLTAELKPWWARKLIQTVLSNKKTEMLRVEEGRFVVQLPGQLTQNLELRDFVVNETGITVLARALPGEDSSQVS